MLILNNYLVLVVRGQRFGRRDDVVMCVITLLTDFTVTDRPEV